MRSYFFVLSLMVFSNTVFAVPADWYDPGFKARLQTFLYVPSVGNPVAAWPVAVHLGSSDIDWDLIDPNGDDLMFIDHRTDSRISFDIDHWDYAPAEAVIWLRVVDITPGDIIPISIYFDNDTTVSLEDPSATFQDFILVHHMQAPFLDASPSGFDGTPTGGYYAVPGVTGEAVEFSSGYLSFGRDVSAAFGSSFYISFWTQAYNGSNDLGSSPGIFGSLTNSGSFWDGLAFGLVKGNGESAVYARNVGLVSAGDVTRQTTHIGMSWDSGNTTTTYNQGRRLGGESAGALPNFEVLGLGIITKPVSGLDSHYAGIIDEVRVFSQAVVDELPPTLDYLSAADSLFDLCPVSKTYYYDGDSDGFGGTTNFTGCYERLGYVSTTGDCDDDDPAVNPDAIEIKDGIDNNCTGGVDEGFEEYAIGGTVSGLEGTGLVLQNNLEDDFSAVANGAFAFLTKLSDHADYTVTVWQQPVSPAQFCSVTNGSGSLAGADVDNVNVSCVTRSEEVFIDGFEE